MVRPAKILASPGIKERQQRQQEGSTKEKAQTRDREHDRALCGKQYTLYSKLTELVNALRQQAIKQREREGELLNNIAYLAGLETAEAAADIYAAEKHAYSFDGYLYQLEKLKTVLAAGVPSEIALEAVDSCADADAIIKYYRGGTA